jgi:hypothetical protein
MSQHIQLLTEERLARAFEEALTFREFYESMQVNRKAFVTNYIDYELSDDEKEFFTRLEEPIDVLVLAHDWCGDVVANLPLFGKIERETEKLRLHILLRDPDNQDLAAHYVHRDGRNHIPTYIFFDKNRREIGVFIERTDEITCKINQWKQEFWDAHPELDGRGKTIGELEGSVKRALLKHISEQRTTVKLLEKQTILSRIQEIIGK